MQADQRAEGYLEKSWIGALISYGIKRSVAAWKADKKEAKSREEETKRGNHPDKKKDPPKRAGGLIQVSCPFFLRAMKVFGSWRDPGQGSAAFLQGDVTVFIDPFQSQRRVFSETGRNL